MENEISMAIEAIKNAILTSQYNAAKDVNRHQLSLYFGIGNSWIIPTNQMKSQNYLQMTIR